jgi:secreted trypsin-like serine protease
VVAIEIDKAVHCSGVVISKQTILTAAHCIKNYEPYISSNRMTYTLGLRNKPPDIAYRGNIEKYAIFPGYTPYIHDVGVLYTNGIIPAGSAALHQKLPEWSDIINNKVKLTFVGFGYGTPPDEIGVKREAAWGIDSADDWSVHYPAGNTGVCMGDSGGPAFDTTGASPLVMGITSTNYGPCNVGGTDTRVDAHYQWILSQLK